MKTQRRQNAETLVIKSEFGTYQMSSIQTTEHVSDMRFLQTPSKSKTYKLHRKKRQFHVTLLMKRIKKSLESRKS